MNWIVYILECSDKTLYTGITPDLEKRLERHTNGTGAKYTKGRGPFKVLYTETCEDRSKATRREYLIKALTRKKKFELIKDSRF